MFWVENQVFTFFSNFFIFPGENKRINPIMIPVTPTSFPIIAMELKIISLIKAYFWELKKILAKVVISSLNTKKMRINPLPTIKETPAIT